MKKLLASIVLLFICTIAFSQITLTSSVSNVSCFGGTNGSATVTASGGTGPYTYTWAPTATNSPTITGLWAGQYTVTVMDASMSTNFLVVTITEPPPFSTTLTTTNPTCEGMCNGTANIAFSGGTGTTTFLWQPGLQSGNNVNYLCAGTQTVTITSNGVCNTSLTFTLTEPAQLTAVNSSTNSNCGQANGKTCSLVAGGTPPLNYLWSNGVSTLCNNNVVAGLYTFTVTDVNGCVANSTGLVNDVAGVIVSISSQTNISCFGGNNGKAIAQVFGGVTPITYSWTTSTSTTTTASNLFAGVCGVTAIDAAGCIGTANVNITQPTQLTATVATQNTVTCMCDGSATVTVTGGNAPYNYMWQTPFGNTMPQVTNLCPGVTGVSITDINGCVVTQTVAIMPAPSTTVVTTSTTTACQANCNGAASATVTGGTGSYTYQWMGPSIASGSTSNNPIGMCPGLYTLVVTDAMGCVTATTVNVSTANSIPNASVTSTIYNETCLYTGDGAIDLSLTGSNPGPFTYQWNNGAATQDLNNIPSGSYLVTIYDNNSNCVSLYNTIGTIGTNCGTISGNVFADNNSDCLNNTGDNNLNGVVVMINPGNRIGYTNPIGNYTINNLPYGTYSVTANTNNFYFLATCNTTYTSSVNGGSPNSINNNFTREYIPLTQPDLHVSAYSNGIVPGFVCTVNYSLYNYNTFNASGIYKVTLPPAFIPNITQVSPATYTLSGDTIIWSFTNITNSNITNFFVKFITPLSTPLGSTFTSCIWAQPTVTDLNYVNNTYCYSRTVMGSFDPNDKTVSPVGVGPNGYIAATETDLTYLIRFQNTGNGPAVNIVVKDTLSPNLDINTFEMVSSSHNYNIDILPGNILRWKFNNIMLPDSNSNEPGSHGYIQYRIKRTNNNAPGTQIKNTAYIYFDFNEPVVTNTATNTIETITGIQSQNIANDQWLIYPNPSTGILNLINNSIASDSKLHIQIVNTFGQLVYEENTSVHQKTMV